MKKIFSIILVMLCIFSFNTFFNTQTSSAKSYNIIAVSTTTIDQQPEDVLERPVFEPEKKQPKVKKITGKLSSLIIKIFGGILLCLVIIICLSFIWFANLQKQRDKKKKRLSANANVINAVDNFAKHRIKR